MNKKILDIDELREELNRVRAEGKKIVFTNGCFDIIHRGHVEYLQKAKELGDLLVLGLNSDASVKRLKGINRPINNETDRAVVLSAFECVDYITIFNEDTPLELIKIVKPDMLIKGGDYKPEDIVGREYAKETVSADFVEGYSTTKIIDRARL